MTPQTIDVAGTGFTVLDRVYTDNRKSFEALGGSCGNVLISLAMLDHSVVPLLALGQDDVGTALIHEFEQAGAETKFIWRRSDISSPVLAQKIDTTSFQHSFSFICPETQRELPRYCSIEEKQVDAAKKMINTCHLFYADRLSEAILDAMKIAADGGSIVYFEPSSICDEALFARALDVTTILKYSSDRLDRLGLPTGLRSDAISIITHGASGLEVRQRSEATWCPSTPIAKVRDTCGAGDMVSVGVIDWILRLGYKDDHSLTVDALLHGIVAGQRLAAANCAFSGARGLFQHHGPALARQVLDDASTHELSQLYLF
jgi:fructokinase